MGVEELKKCPDRVSMSYFGASATMFVSVAGLPPTCWKCGKSGHMKKKCMAPSRAIKETKLHVPSPVENIQKKLREVSPVADTPVAPIAQSSPVAEKNVPVSPVTSCDNSQELVLEKERVCKSPAPVRSVTDYGES